MIRNRISSWALNFEFDSNSESARRSKFKLFEAEYRVGLEFRASSKIEIQNNVKPNIELVLNFEQVLRSKFKSRRIFDFNKFEFRSPNCLEIQIQLDIRLQNECFEFRSSSWLKIHFQLDIQFQSNLNFDPRAGSTFKSSSMFGFKTF